MPSSTTKRAATATMARSKPRRLSQEHRNKSGPPTEPESNFFIHIAERRTGRRIPFQEAMQRLGYKRTGPLGITPAAIDERMEALTMKTLGRIAEVHERRLTELEDRRSNDDDAPLEPFPVAKSNITPEERARLADPNFITEDEADNIICDRRLREGGRLISLPQLLKRYGRKPRAPVAH